MSSIRDNNEISEKNENLGFNLYLKHADNLINLLTLVGSILSGTILVFYFQIPALFALLFGILTLMIGAQLYSGYKTYLRDQEIQNIFQKE